MRFATKADDVLAAFRNICSAEVLKEPFDFATALFMIQVLIELEKEPVWFETLHRDCQIKWAVPHHPGRSHCFRGPMSKKPRELLEEQLRNNKSVIFTNS